MQKPAVLLSLAVILSACSLLDENDGEPTNPDTNSAPTVQLTASPQSGPAPLTVNLSAAATDPEGDTLSYSWSLQGLGSAAAAATVFNEVGTFPVTVTVSDGTSEVQASTTVTVTGEDPVDPEPPTDPTDPEPPTTEPEITLKASPGGPAPWAVRYDYTATGYPEGSVVSLNCGLDDDDTFGDSNILRTDIDSDTTACLHLANTNTVMVNVLASDDSLDVLDTKTIKADVQPQGDVPFAGTWRVTLDNEDPITFVVTKPTEIGIGGSDETGDYAITYGSLDDAGAINLRIQDKVETDFDDDIELAPLEDGTQRFVTSETYPETPFVLEKID